MPGDGYTVIPSTGFGGGLNLRDAPDVLDPAQAMDCLNTTFTERGVLKSRDGYVRLAGTALTNRVDSLETFYNTAGDKHLLCGCDTRLEAVTPSGSVAGFASGLQSGTWDFARYGQPNAERVYAGQGLDTLRRWTGSAWDAPTATVNGAPGAMPKAGLLQVDADENRLFATGFRTTTGGPGGATSSPSHVYISEAGDPETWDTTLLLQLRPGDGERIMGITAFRDLVFIFKETCFFVVYGSSADATGKPEFNYRTVLGAGLASSRALVAARDGVYFMGREGVYRTEGDEPQLVSELIEPIFLSGANQFFRSSPLNHASISRCAMGAWDDRIYLAYPSGASDVNDRVLVYDPRYGWWSIWDIPMSSMTRFRIADTEELVFGLASGDRNIGRYRGRGLVNSDDLHRDGFGGNPIEARWRSGWFDFGDPNVKKIRELHLTGSGDFEVAIAKDWEVTPRNGETISIVATNEVWGDGTDPDKLWSDGTDEDDIWGPRSLIRSRMVRGVSTRGKVFSVLLNSSGTSSDLWSDGTNPDDLWGGGIEITDRWADGSDPSDVWGDGSDPLDTWGDGTRDFEGDDSDTWGPEPVDPFSVHRLEHHLLNHRPPSVVRTEA